MSAINLLMIALCSVFGPGSELISLRSTFCNPTIISQESDNLPPGQQQQFNHHHNNQIDNLNQILGPLKSSSSLSVLLNGARKGMKECQKVFKDERWNCTPSETDPRKQIFDSTMIKGINSI